MSPGRRPMVLLLPLAWLAVVVVVAGVTWQVIDSAGRQVLTGAPAPLTASGATSGPRSGPSTPPRSRAPSGRAESSGKPAPSKAPAPQPSAGPGGTGATQAAPSVAPSATSGSGQPAVR